MRHLHNAGLLKSSGRKTCHSSATYDRICDCTDDVAEYEKSSLTQTAERFFEFCCVWSRRLNVVVIIRLISINANALLLLLLLLVSLSS